MYENMVDVLIYLYETYFDGEAKPPLDQSELEDELIQAGFTAAEIEQALRWLDELVAGREHLDARAGRDASGTTRIYSADECGKLDLECRGLLELLQQNGILDSQTREMVIERALAIAHDQVSVDDLRWVVLLVLMNHPGQEAAFSQMEELVFDDQLVWVH